MLEPVQKRSWKITWELCTMAFNWDAGKLNFYQLYIRWTARSIAQIEVLFPTLLEKLFWWFQWSRGSNLWPNNTVNTKFCVKIFLGARMSQPPQNALYHTVQMVLVGAFMKQNLILIVAFLCAYLPFTSLTVSLLFGISKKNKYRHCLIFPIHAIISFQ